MKYKAMGENVILKRISSEDEIRESGLVIQENRKKEIYDTGTVLSVGDKVKDIEEGDIVVYRRFRATDLDFEETKTVEQEFIYYKKI